MVREMQRTLSIFQGNRKVSASGVSITTPSLLSRKEMEQVLGAILNLQFSKEKGEEGLSERESAAFSGLTQEELERLLGMELNRLVGAKI